VPQIHLFGAPRLLEHHDKVAFLMRDLSVSECLVLAEDMSGKGGSDAAVCETVSVTRKPDGSNLSLFCFGERGSGVDSR